MKFLRWALLGGVATSIPAHHRETVRFQHIIFSKNKPSWSLEKLNSLFALASFSWMGIERTNTINLMISAIVQYVGVGGLILDRLIEKRFGKRGCGNAVAFCFCLVSSLFRLFHWSNTRHDSNNILWLVKFCSARPPDWQQ